jgi:hypothetical protein
MNNYGGRFIPLLSRCGFFPAALAAVVYVFLAGNTLAFADDFKLAGTCLVLDYDRNFPAGQPVQTSYAWSGTCAADGMAEGRGSLRAFWNGHLDELTTGTMLRGRLEGFAVTTSPNGFRFAGHYRDGRCNGGGSFSGRNRAGLSWRYIGNFVNGLADGQGVETLGNGERYEGSFVAGRRSGQGVQSGPGVAGVAYRYEGGFVDGQWSGHGVLSWANGDRYEGEFRAGTRQGQGVFTRAGGERYAGEFFDGQPAANGSVYLVQENPLFIKHL